MNPFHVSLQEGYTLHTDSKRLVVEFVQEYISPGHQERLGPQKMKEVLEEVMMVTQPGRLPAVSWALIFWVAFA